MTPEQLEALKVGLQIVKDSGILQSLQNGNAPDFEHALSIVGYIFSFLFGLRYIVINGWGSKIIKLEEDRNRNLDLLLTEIKGLKEITQRNVPHDHLPSY